jgi:hypothetical protein
MSKIDSLDSLIRESLLALAEFLSKNDWRGREREVVSLYAFGFLVPRCRAGGPLHDPTQIGLDVAVRQLAGEGRKYLVCKDLVLWGEPASTCWDESGEAVRAPMAILEWKARTNKINQHDEKWLLDYSKFVKGFIGYAVSINSNKALTSIMVSRANGGVLEKDWINYNILKS